MEKAEIIRPYTSPDTYRALVGNNIFLTEEVIETVREKSFQDWKLYCSISKRDEQELGKIDFAAWDANYTVVLLKEMAEEYSVKHCLPGEFTLNNIQKLNNLKSEKRQLMRMIVDSDFEVGEESILNKLILIFYINVGNIPEYDVREYLGKIKNMLTLDIADLISFFIPIRDGENRIEHILASNIKKEDEGKFTACMQQINDIFYKILIKETE